MKIELFNFYLKCQRNVLIALTLLSTLFFSSLMVHAADSSKRAGDLHIYMDDLKWDYNGLGRHLTEEQARLIILEEAKRAGVELTPLYSVTFEEVLFFSQLSSTTFDMFYRNFMYMSLIDREAIEKTYSTSPFALQK